MLKVAVDTKPPQQDFNNEITNFRERIQQCIEQELNNIEDVEIVDRAENEWVYYIEIKFLFRKSIDEHSPQSLANISADIISDKEKKLAGYHAPKAYEINNLPVVCRLIVEFLNDFYLEKVRSERRKQNNL